MAWLALAISLISSVIAFFKLVDDHKYPAEARAIAFIFMVLLWLPSIHIYAAQLGWVGERGWHFYWAVASLVLFVPWAVKKIIQAADEDNGMPLLSVLASVPSVIVFLTVVF